ncbi:MAG: hypothetical protein DRN53_03780 [Thermoprotei archaeon]|nr:MAG: hypothetical protein DRN53_03780 [Thermoprotei archaeon]
MREDLRELLEAAEDDLDTARKLYELGKYRYACFFTQQAVEKYLKAYLLYKTNRYPFTHSIIKLIKEAIKHDRDLEYLLKVKADSLEDYYTGVRYPPLIKVTREEAKEAIGIAEEVRILILKKLSMKRS